MAHEEHAGRPTLLLVPTELERRRLLDEGGLPLGLALEAVCGFGPVAAAAATARLLAELTPARCLLVGIAGAYDLARDPLGTALEFAAVALSGVGVGQGRDFVAPPALGFRQAPASSSPPPPSGLELLPLARTLGPRDAGLLLSVCAASASAEEARLRRERFPEARAEDMEGFGVALACARAGVPLCIVRGISNEVGDRHHERWSIPRALGAARRRVLEILEDPRAWTWSAEEPRECRSAEDLRECRSAEDLRE
jgi:futalosine hydrolase